MGYNATIMILMDRIHNIKEDKDSGRKLYDAVTRLHGSKSPVNIDHGAQAIEIHHASYHTGVIIGGNTGFVTEQNEPPYPGAHITELSYLKRLAAHHGYTLTKKRTPKVK
jgi:hypothetical protein